MISSVNVSARNRPSDAGHCGGLKSWAFLVGEHIRR